MMQIPLLRYLVHVQLECCYLRLLSTNISYFTSGSVTIVNLKHLFFILDVASWNVYRPLIMHLARLPPSGST